MTEVILVRKSDDAVVGPVMTEGRGWVRDAGRTLVSPPIAGWEDDEYRLAVVDRLVVPDGKQVVGSVARTFDGARVVETATLEDVPVPPVLTRAEKVAALAADYDLTVDDLKAELGIATR